MAGSETAAISDAKTKRARIRIIIRIFTLQMWLSKG
jgi:hypothetical protein